MDEAKRERIARILKEASNQKLLRGGQPRARGELTRVYAEVADLPGPWRALCAYRLAHVLMRDTKPDLEEADRLFLEAGRARSLGPWPYLYRVAVVARQGAPEHARNALSHATEALASWPSGVHDDAEDPSTPREARLQDDVFNLLELACYFVGGDYGALEGLGQRAGGFDDESHRVVTSDPASARVAVTRDFAWEEMLARAVRAPDAVLFELSAGERARWKLVGGRWEDVDHRWIRLLASVGAGRARHAGQLRDLVCGETDGVSGRERRADALFRQIKARVRRKLGLTGPPFSERDGRLGLDLPIVGVVYWRTLTTPPDPPDLRVTRRSRPAP